MTLDTFETRWRGRSVSVSTCGDEELRPVVRHWFDATVGLVVRSLSRDGRVEELRDIRAMSLSPSTFNVSDDLRDVGIREFMLGTSELGEFPASSVEDPSESQVSLNDLQSGHSGHQSLKE